MLGDNNQAIIPANRTSSKNFFSIMVNEASSCGEVGYVYKSKMLEWDSEMTHLKGFKTSKSELVPWQQALSPGCRGCHQKEAVTCEGCLIAAEMLSQKPLTFGCRDKPRMENGALYQED